MIMQKIFYFILFAGIFYAQGSLALGMAKEGSDTSNCGSYSYSYADDGRVTVTDNEGNVLGTYSDFSAALTDMYGYAPEMTLSASGNNSQSEQKAGRLIYTVQEAEKLSKPTGNRFRLRYK